MQRLFIYRNDQQNAANSTDSSQTPVFILLSFYFLKVFRANLATLSLGESHCYCVNVTWQSNRRKDNRSRNSQVFWRRFTSVHLAVRGWLRARDLPSLQRKKQREILCGDEIFYFFYWKVFFQSRVTRSDPARVQAVNENKRTLVLDIDPTWFSF